MPPISAHGTTKCCHPTVLSALTESEPVTEPFGQRHFFVRDPAGTWIDVIQLVEPDPEWAAANLPPAR